jgi:phasin family protein
MAEPTDEKTQSAEKAYAEAAAKVKPVEAAPPKAVPAETPPAAPAPVAPKPVAATKTTAPKKPAAASRKIEKPAAPKPAAKTNTAKTNTALAKAAKRAARVAKAAAAPAAVKTIEPTLTVSELKEKIMATAKTTDFTKPIADVVGEFQNSAKAAYEKSAEAVTEMTEFTKGNVEAIVESSKIFAVGAQSLGKTYVEEAKSAYETLTADVKEIAAVKSPTELFQLQGKIARRNFDTLVATSSKNTEAFLKLANDAFAPLTGRVEIATEKLAKVA